jgi:hypothetical protein
MAVMSFIERAPGAFLVVNLSPYFQSVSPLSSKTKKGFKIWLQAWDNRLVFTKCLEFFKSLQGLNHCLKIVSLWLHVSLVKMFLSSKVLCLPWLLGQCHNNRNNSICWCAAQGVPTNKVLLLMQAVLLITMPLKVTHVNKT